jgi:NAD(P)H-nitrite reductase large subunit
VSPQYGKRHVIIGNGIAGLSAAAAIRAHDAHCAIRMITDEPYQFYSRPGLAYMLTGTIPERQLYPYPKAYHSQQNIDLTTGRVVEISAAAGSVRLEKGDEIPFDALLLATGAKAILPDLPGRTLQGVVTLDTLSDARRILKLARRARGAVVIGGGITALELAEGLAAQGVRVHYLMRKGRYWSSVLDADESALVESRLEEEGVCVRSHTQISRILERGGRVRGVETEEGETIRCQMVAIAIGIRPRAELARAGGVAIKRGILVDEYMRTNLPSVYAAGDVAQVFDPRTGESQLDTLWWSAAEQGRIAGMNMAGAPTSYARPVPFNVTRIGGLTTTIIGAVGLGTAEEDLIAIARGDSESWRQKPTSLVLERDESEHRVRLVLGEDHILGALIMGDQSLSRSLQYLVREKVDISPIRRDLMTRREDWDALISDYVKQQTRAAHEA